MSFFSAIEDFFTQDVLPGLEGFLKSTVSADVKAVLPLAAEAVGEIGADLVLDGSNTGLMTQQIAQVVQATGAKMVTAAVQATAASTIAAVGMAISAQAALTPPAS